MRMQREVPIREEGGVVKNCVIKASRWKLFRRLFKYGCTLRCARMKMKVVRSEANK